MGTPSNPSTVSADATGVARRGAAAETIRRLLGDAALALVALAIGIGGTRPAGEHQAGTAHVDPRAYVFVVVAAVSLVVRRRYPRVTLAVATLAVAPYLILNYPYGPILFSFLISVYTVAAHLPIRAAAIAAAGSLVAIVAHVFSWVDGAPGLAGVLPASAWVVVPFAVGVTVRLSRESVARAREESARRHADDERLRIAQEVHDVVGHGLAAINMQAEIALHLLPKRPEQAESALAAISRTSKEALDELRATLSVVRRGDDRADDRAPTPGLGQLETLRSRLAGAGLPVTVEIFGAARPLPVAVDLAAYRVVQESLTNVLRHAGTATATVTIRYEEAALTVEVLDTGRGGPVAGGAGGGHGLAGMRERVGALGGELTVGPAPDGGFRVYAKLPVEPRP